MPSPANSWLKPRVAETADYAERFLGYDLVAGQPLTDEDRRQLLVSIAAHERALQAAPNAVVVAELAALDVLTTRRNLEHDDLKLRQQVYARKLADYPGDVVLHVLQTQASLSKWWPAWEELEDRLASLTHRRKSRLEALRRLASGEPIGSRPERRGQPFRRLGSAMPGRPKCDAAPEPKVAEPLRPNEDQLAASGLSPADRKVFWSARMSGKDTAAALAMARGTADVLDR